LKLMRERQRPLPYENTAECGGAVHAKGGVVGSDGLEQPM
jgi:hypothetical protein